MYGVPDIDIDTRQNRRYSLEENKIIQYINKNEYAILAAISSVNKYRMTGKFGAGNSRETFLQLINNKAGTDIKEQKVFAFEFWKDSSQIHIMWW